MSSIGSAVVKLCLTLVNLLLLLLALSVFLLGVRMSQRPPETVMIKEWMNITSSMLIVIGFALLILTIVGLGGTLCKSNLLLHSYIYFLLITTAVLVTLFSCLFVFKQNLNASASEQFKEMMANFSDFSDPTASNVVQTVQSIGACCGDKSPDDWQHLNMTLAHTEKADLLKNGSELPASCCGHTPLLSLMVLNGSSVALCPSAQLLYLDGCFNEVQVMRYQNTATATFAVLVLSLVLIITCACCLQHDRKLQVEKIRNLQYAAHLHTCLMANDAAGSTNQAVYRRVSRRRRNE